MRGLIHIYEGDGKGKTSAGVGLAVRCAGSGQKVIYTQFLKTDDSSELKMLEQLENIHLVRCSETYGFVFTMDEKTREEARQFYTDHFRKVAALAREEGARLLVLDEIIASYNLDMVDPKELLDFLRNKPEELEVVLTGRDPSPELCELADYISGS